MIDHRTHREARVAPTAIIGAFVVIGAGAGIGDRVRIEPFVYIGARVIIGARSIVYPHAFIAADVTIGEDCIIDPCAVILADVPAGAMIGAAQVWPGPGLNTGLMPATITTPEPAKAQAIADEVAKRAGASLKRGRR